VEEINTSFGLLEIPSVQCFGNFSAPGFGREVPRARFCVLWLQRWRRGSNFGQ